ncbi:anchored repeat-type ABC transporter ATP-binding subunit [Actinoalloteichus sp. AHMU CJ021]|uniref:Manganese/iron transport system ATP-binding protein n=1 Tax=Actinoalloteichus caeruleus DSM 43889 TaxID=1120930 RepID=A0ABT1JHD9_ACTCY|nr:anchored repeat-type ABC transporter ATP-binding subunit [Actinoalloteichus caeruleus]AUS77372.1 anchored repeat-type ABC transporter ATP-binding subunit [Actinoalloteichus sp. AHMU CJ021]MCP2331196.1 manganese/iron transport system ATP-binding protein [Actinoalloteichus caeruleus DSM 43889]
MAEPLVRVDGLSVDLGGRTALRDVDLAVSAGELVGLIGPNGAGKTTLLRAVLGLLPPRAGTIHLGDRTPDRARGTVGYVPQRHEFAWDFPISVEKAVLTGRVHRVGWLRRPGAVDRDAVDEALDRVSLGGLRRRPVGELSGGQRQRVLVARALALRPELLLLDEPFTGLDVPTQELLTELFEALRREGRALLMTTHDLPAAASLSTRLCLLNRTVIADGPPAGLRDPSVWLAAFGVAGSASLLRSLGVDT